MEELFTANTHNLLKVCISTIGVFIGVITYTRIAGLRSFSKMSGFDFAMTIAVGSLMATTAVLQISLVEGLFAIGILYAFQVAIAFIRRYSFLSQIIDNKPMLLFRDGEFLHKNMKSSRVTRSDIYSKLRQANIKDIIEVHAIVLETTGDISVISGGKKISTAILHDVKK